MSSVLELKSCFDFKFLEKVSQNPNQHMPKWFSLFEVFSLSWNNIRVKALWIVIQKILNSEKKSPLGKQTGIVFW